MQKNKGKTRKFDQYDEKSPVSRLDAICMNRNEDERMSNTYLSLLLLLFFYCFIDDEENAERLCRLIICL